MNDNIETYKLQNQSNGRSKSNESNRTDDTDHPKNIYVPPADFEWLLRYLDDDD